MMIRKSPALKILIIVVLFIVFFGGALFIYRYQILQYSAGKIVRRILPHYITIEKMGFHFKDNKVVLEGLKILNPPNFPSKYLVEIDEVACRYKLKGKNILDGVEIQSPVLIKPVLFIDRLADARINLQELTSLLQDKGTSPKASIAERSLPKAVPSGDRGLSAIVKLPEDFTVKGGKVIFVDGMVAPGRYTITLEDIDARLRLVLDGAYTKALNVATVGSGTVNGKPGEVVRWDTKLDPTVRQLTMSNRFNVTGVDITAFSPYYDRYSPFVFKRGYFSGLLIFDFADGSIGSTNEVNLSKMSFSVKKGYENSQYLETTVPDLVKYFTSSRGDIIFDFKIKGLMADPKFYLGPISKQAVASMAIDKISQALVKAQGALPAGEGSDIEKASKYIDMFKSLLKDKR